MNNQATRTILCTLLCAGFFNMVALSIAATKLSLGSAYAFAGQTVELELRLSGATTPCAGVNAKVLLPPGVSLLGIEKGGLLYPGQFATDYRAFSGGCTVIAYSGTDTFSGGDGVLLRLLLSVGAQVSPGTYPITFATANTNINVNSRYALSDATGEHSLPVTPENGLLVVDTDSNHNSMGDLWEMAMFGTTARDGTGDYDQDGLTDAQEFSLGTYPTLKDTDEDGMSDAAEIVAGTNPADPSDCFKISDLEMVTMSGPFILYWDSKINRSYTVYGSSNLLSGWNALLQLSGDGSRKAFTNLPPSSLRFFRLDVQQIP